MVKAVEEPKQVTVATDALFHNDNVELLLVIVPPFRPSVVNAKLVVPDELPIFNVVALLASDRLSTPENKLIDIYTKDEEY